MVAAEAVGVDVLGLHAGSHHGCVFRDGSLGDGAGDGGEDPAGNAEEIEDILQEDDQHHAGSALGKAGDRLHNQLNHSEDVNLQDKGQQVAQEQADEDGDDVVEPVLDKVGDDAVLTEEGIFGHQLVDHIHQQAHKHGGEHAAGAELAEIHQGTAVHGLEVHAHHVGADAGKAGDEGAVFFVNLVQAVVGDNKDHKQADEAEGIGADGADVRQGRDEIPDDGPDGGDGADHREGDDVQNGIGYNAEPEIGCNLIDDRDQNPLDPRLYLFHVDPPARLTWLLKVSCCKTRWHSPGWPRRPGRRSHRDRWK